MAMPIESTNALESLTKAGFKVDVAYDTRGWDAEHLWYVSARTDATRPTGGVKQDGRKILTRSGTNEYHGSGKTVEAAVINLIENAGEISARLPYPGGYYIVPNTDPKTAKEQPIKIIYEGASEATSGQCDAIAEASTKAAVGAGHVKTEEGRNLRLFLRSHGNSAHDLTMLVNSGIITANEARTLAGIGPINNPS